MSSHKLFRFWSVSSNADLDPAFSSATPQFNRIEIHFSQRSVISTLLKIVFALVILHLITLFDRFVLTEVEIFPSKLFDLDAESNFPAYFSSVLLLLSSALLALIAAMKQRAGERFVRHWQALSLIFLGLSMDEMLSLHERLTTPLRGALKTEGIFHFTWVVPALFFVVALLLAYRKFLLALPAKTCKGILLAGGIYLSGTLGSEMLGGLWASTSGKQDLVYDLLTAVEESLEMVGLIVFISVLLSLLKPKH